MIFDLLDSRLDDQAAETIGKQIGADKNATRDAIVAALPMILGGLTRNSRDSQGARSLNRALKRDHSGDVLDRLSSFLGDPDTRQGDAILGHVFGGQERAQLESGLSAKTGISAGQISQLLAVLAPIVMGAIGQAKRRRDVGSGDLFDMLRGETRRAGQQPQADLGMLSMLDRDGDGSILDDAAGMLGKFFP